MFEKFIDFIKYPNLYFEKWKTNLIDSFYANFSTEKNFKKFVIAGLLFLGMIVGFYLEFLDRRIPTEGKEFLDISFFYLNIACLILTVIGVLEIFIRNLEKMKNYIVNSNNKILYVIQKMFLFGVLFGLIYFYGFIIYISIFWFGNKIVKEKTYQLLFYPKDFKLPN